MNGSALIIDDTHITWKTDVDKRFPATTALNFNTVPELRGGGTITGPIKVGALQRSMCRKLMRTPMHRLWQLTHVRKYISCFLLICCRPTSVSCASMHKMNICMFINYKICMADTVCDTTRDL